MVASTDNFVKQKSTSTGTGNFTLSDLSPARRSFNTAFGTGGTDKFQYAIYHQGNNQYEFGTGHLSDSTTLVRDTVEDSSNGDSLVDFTSGDKIVLCDIPASKYGSPKGYLEPGALTISNNGTDSDHDIDVTGGIVGVHDFSGEWFRVELADETPAFQIDTTGDDGLINGSSLTADTWYELGVIADSSGSNSPSVVGYTDANRPTASSDLPSGYDLFRAMGTPGNGWWVRTDGSSNIRGLNHYSSGDIQLTQSEREAIGDIYQNDSPNNDTNNTLKIDGFIPPTKCIITLSFWINADGSFDSALGVSSESISTIDRAEAFAQGGGSSNDRVGDTYDIYGIENQTINYYPEAASQLFISSVTRVRPL